MRMRGRRRHHINVGILILCQKIFRPQATASNNYKFDYCCRLHDLFIECYVAAKVFCCCIDKYRIVRFLYLSSLRNILLFRKILFNFVGTSQLVAMCRFT